MYLLLSGLIILTGISMSTMHVLIFTGIPIIIGLLWGWAIIKKSAVLNHITFCCSFTLILIINSINFHLFRGIVCGLLAFIIWHMIDFSAIINSPAVPDSSPLKRQLLKLLLVSGIAASPLIALPLIIRLKINFIPGFMLGLLLFTAFTVLIIQLGKYISTHNKD